MNSISFSSVPGPWLCWTSCKSFWMGRVPGLLGNGNYKRASRELAIKGKGRHAVMVSRTGRLTGGLAVGSLWACLLALGFSGPYGPKLSVFPSLALK